MDNCSLFARLPNELILMVTENCGMRELAALSGVSKKFMSFADLSSSEMLISAYTIAA